ncbi:hypothetical protein KCU71_g3538, partial [Aureobasidium melanogenum]
MAANSLSQDVHELSITDDLISENSALFDQVVELQKIKEMQLKESNEWKKLAEVIHEQSSMIDKLEKDIAKMKGPQKIKEEISTLEKELKELKREIELAGEDKDREAEDPPAEKC